MLGKITFLTKRRPMGRDLFNDPYGRFFYLPSELAKLGYDVTVVAVSYRAGEDDQHEKHGIHWKSVSFIPNVLAAYGSLQEIIDTTPPRWIVGCSDTYFGILAERIARTRGCYSVIDAYDNYCSYIPWAKPLHNVWNRAIARSDLTTVAGPSLAELWDPLRGSKGSTVIPMAPDPVGFFLRDRYRSRYDLGLPIDAPLVGYSGSIGSSRGIETLFEACDLARKSRPDLTLVLSGRISNATKLPANTIYLGYLPKELVPSLINAFDVMAVINKDSSFGNYSYPIKLYEAMACQIPIVASRTRSTEYIAREYPEFLVDPSNVSELSIALLDALDRGRVTYQTVPTWSDSAWKLHLALQKLLI
jgi:glycosyltransferase involved in cell wall biosynthesis